MTQYQNIILDINKYIEGDDTIGDQICEALEPPIRTAVFGCLSPQDPDCDDIVQDSLIAMLTYLRKARVAPNNPVAFAVTIAKNRCTNLHIWRRHRKAENIDKLGDKLPHSVSSPLDLISERQQVEILRNALHKLDQKCRRLLEAIYCQESTIEDLRCSLGLKSVQAVYYRRDTCLQKAGKILNRDLINCRLTGNRNKESQNG